MMRFGLLGCGRIGHVHAGSIRHSTNASVVAVADANPAAAEKLAYLTGARVLPIESILSAKDVDAVIICTPTDFSRRSAGSRHACWKACSLREAREPVGG